MSNDEPINIKAEQSPADPNDWAVSFDMCHTPNHIFVNNLSEVVKHEKDSTHIYVEQNICHPVREHGNQTEDRIVCSECGCVLAISTFVRVWQKYCPTCGSKVIDWVGAR